MSYVRVRYIVTSKFTNLLVHDQVSIFSSYSQKNYFASTFNYVDLIIMNNYSPTDFLLNPVKWNTDKLKTQPPS